MDMLLYGDGSQQPVVIIDVFGVDKEYMPASTMVSVQMWNFGLQVEVNIIREKRVLVRK